jgi:predicted nucleotidyltransferase
VSADFGLSAAVRAKLQRVFETIPGIDRVWIYGSRARGDYQTASDVDLAVEAESRQAFTNVWSAVERLELLYRIDLVDLTRLSDSALRANIDREKRVFWERTVEMAEDRRGTKRLHLN